MTDVSAADWLVEEIGEFGSGVRGLLPSRFEAYARILHRAWHIIPAPTEGIPERVTGEEITWEEIAKATNRVFHPRVQFDSLTGVSRYAQGQPEYTSEEGELAPELLSALCEVLAPHTSAADRCWFCLWEGWGWIDGSPSVALIGGPATDLKLAPAFPPEIMNGPRVRLPAREYILFEAPLEAATEMGERSGEQVAAAQPGIDLAAYGLADDFTPQSPSIFWPDDQSWCVATEIDLDSTYVGGPKELIEATLGDERFEAWPAGLDDRVDAGGDEINPLPPDPDQ